MELVKKSNDEQAWVEIFNRYHRLIYHTICRKVWGFDRTDWDDIAQDISIEFCQAIPKFRGENKEGQKCKLSTYLMNIALKICNKKYEEKLRRAERKKDIDTRWPEQAACIFVSPEAQTLEKENEAELIEIWSGLAQNIRYILYLHYIVGLTYDEIAEQLQIRSDNLRQKVKRALDQVKKKVVQKKISPEQFYRVGLRALHRSLAKDTVEEVETYEVPKT